jgi:predicted O-methyltransferase YrrM
MLKHYWKAIEEYKRLREYHKGDDSQAIALLGLFVDYSEPGQFGTGEINEGERKQLIDWVIGFADVPGPVVEIGTLFGFSTMALCEGVHRSGVRKKIITVDNYGWNPFGVPVYRHRMITKHNLRFAQSLTDLEIVDSVADDFYKGFTELPSFAFIDGDHSYETVKKDLAFFKRIGARAISGHDYNFPDVCRAVKEVLGEDNLTVFDGTLFLYKAP